MESVHKSNRKLTDFRLMCFDVYGTLIDWENGVLTAMTPLLGASYNVELESGPRWSRAEALNEFMAAEGAVQTEHPEMLYSDVLAAAHAKLAERLNVPVTPSQNAAFAASIAQWQPFPDTVDALAKLSGHFKLVVLSNVDRKSFDLTRRLLEKGFTFDKVITAQDVGSYKPSLNNFEYMLKAVKEEFGVERGDVLITAHSLFHDHVPANKLGLCSCWISRKGAIIGRSAQATYDFRFDTLGEAASNA